MVDSTAGLMIIFFGLRFSAFVVTRFGWTLLQSGEYGRTSTCNLPFCVWMCVSNMQTPAGKFSHSAKAVFLEASLCGSANKTQIFRYIRSLATLVFRQLSSFS